MDQRCRTSHIGEQRSDHLAFAVHLAAGFHLGLSGHDTLGQIGRGVVDRGAGRRSCSARGCA
ncbi:hypothetical protein [Cupriavidus numazuensis]|uniref:hypothetical protein n=1 Tax=Cupriavidus numazuensis TaxID=221992 RepID=UPI001FD528A5|nr:hypothetical protein [Cupriavidus numazuensis]